MNWIDINQQKPTFKNEVILVTDGIHTARIYEPGAVEAWNDISISCGIDQYIDTDNDLDLSKATSPKPITHWVSIHACGEQLTGAAINEPTDHTNEIVDDPENNPEPETVKDGRINGSKIYLYDLDQQPENEEEKAKREASSTAFKKKFEEDRRKDLEKWQLREDIIKALVHEADLHALKKYINSLS